MSDDHDTPDEPTGPGRLGAPQRPARTGNEFAVGAMIVGLIALVVSLVTAKAIVPAVLGLVLSGVAISVAVRRDVGVGLALGGLACNLLAVVVAVFSAGIQGG